MTDSRTRTMTEHDDTDDVAQPGEDEHLADLEDGCGCTEVWEHLSAEREED